jgi:phosphoenolpyruvate-protein kinase (PTS system EI component)
MNVLSIFRVKKILRSYTLRGCKELVEAALQLSTPVEIEELVRASLRQKFPDEFRENFNFRSSANSNS